MRIRTKLILLSLVLAGVPFLLLALYSLSCFDLFAQGALSAGVSLGESVRDDNRQGMEDMARAHLTDAASVRAVTLSTELRRVEAALNVFAASYALARSAESTPAPVNDYLCSEQPTTPGRHAIFFLPATVIDADGALRTGIARMGGVFDEAIISNPQLDAIGLATPEGAFAMAPWDFLPDTFDPRARDWHKAALATDGVAWVRPYVSASNHKLVVTCSRAVNVGKNAAGETARAVVFADLDLTRLAKTVLATDMQSASAVLLDREGDIIAQNGMVSDATWNEKVALQNVLTTGTDAEKDLARKMSHGETGVVRGTFFGERDAFVAYAPVNGPGWSIAILMAVSDVLAPVETANRIIERKTGEFRDGGKRYTEAFLQRFLLLGAVGAVVIVLVCLVVGRHVTRPINILADGARAIGAGDFDQRIAVATGDELQELGETVNTMAESLKTYMDNLAKTVAAKERIEQELAVAAQIQLSMLPREFPPFPDRKEIDLHAMMTPAREVGGDFYDYFFTGEDTLWFCIGDVCGKGVPAALFMAITKTLLASGAGQLTSPAAILRVANNLLARNNDSCMFATVFCGFLNVRTGDILYANAGHNPPVIRRADGSHAYHRPQHPGMPIGPMELDGEPFIDETMTLGSGDALLLYTDGVTEAFDPAQEALGEERFLAMQQDKPAQAEPLLKELSGAIRVFVREAEQSDDITMLAILRP